MRFFRTPPLVQQLFPEFTWRKKPEGKQIFLTFDDGPIPEVTEFVMAQLQKFNAKATFFCVGDNVVKYPHIAKQVKAAGHSIGNHTFNHVNGWKTSLPDYLSNSQKCQNVLAETELEKTTGKPLFRPPYGKITRRQAASLQPEFEIVMWDVLSYDFDATLAPEICLQKVLQHTRPGSVVLFHDSLKARRNMEFVLPRFLEHFHSKDHTFSAL